MIGNLGMSEIFVILFVVILLFGAKRLPELAHSLGKSLSVFRHAVNSATDDIKNELHKAGK